MTVHAVVGGGVDEGRPAFGAGGGVTAEPAVIHIVRAGLALACCGVDKVDIIAPGAGGVVAAPLAVGQPCPAVHAVVGGGVDPGRLACGAGGGVAVQAVRHDVAAAHTLACVGVDSVAT